MWCGGCSRRWRERRKRRAGRAARRVEQHGQGRLRRDAARAQLRHGERAQLLLRRRPVVVGRSGTIEGDYEDHVLLESVTSVQLRYFGSVDRRAARQWRHDWPIGRRMPELVELRLADAASGEWPPVLVRPRVDTVRYQNARGAAVGRRADQPRTTPAAGDGGAAAEPEAAR